MKGRNKMKEYRVEVKLVIDNFFQAKNKKEVIKLVKELFLEQYDIELENSEIVEVEEITLPYKQGGK
jgi:hypothetical protein